MIPFLDVGHPLPDALDDPTSLVPEDDRESAFGIVTGERVGVLRNHEI